MAKLTDGIRGLQNAFVDHAGCVEEVGKEIGSLGAQPRLCQFEDAMRAAFVRVLLLALLEVSICSTDGIRPNIFKGEYPVYVHTFDTEQLCRAQCQVECSMHHIDDLMMQRWLCPLKAHESLGPDWGFEEYAPFADLADDWLLGHSIPEKK
ncbi:unnamed protein product [Toxocara canis]|uniref:Apple domain-containing protein n=1 Tax=Toxocara canis TaxID=6265 RepID=A0A183VAJ6_TOXCA|nr:unnamed protein product [Toxocara canis]